MITASEAIRRLKEGNQCFVSGVRSIDTIVKLIQRAGFLEGQKPFAIVNRIRPTVEPLLATELRNDPDKSLEASIHANILAATNHLMPGSQMLENLVQQGKLKIVGAEYSLRTGEVKFLESP